jgi:hypothetical protein
MSRHWRPPEIQTPVAFSRAATKGRELASSLDRVWRIRRLLAPARFSGARPYQSSSNPSSELAVGMTTILAFAPPANRTNRR